MDINIIETEYIFKPVAEEKGMASRPALETLAGQAERLRSYMAGAGLGAAAFADAKRLLDDRPPPPISHPPTSTTAAKQSPI